LSDSVPDGARRAAAHVIVADLDAPHIEEEDRHHLQTVLRLRPGELVSATDGQGAGRLCRYAAGGSLIPDGEIVRRLLGLPSITVGFAPVKGDRPEWTVQKLTEVGVNRIVILRTDLGVVRWDAERATHHLTRLRVVARLAVMQSRQWWLPEVVGVETVRSLVGEPGVAMAEPGGDPPSLDCPSILVGPEGGWSEAELQSARVQVDLGPGVLRTESAAVVAGVLLVALRAGTVRPAGTVGPAGTVDPAGTPCR